MSENKTNLCDGCSLWPCGSHAPIGVDGCIVTECANRKPTSGELIATLKAQRDELLAEVEEWRVIKAAYLIEYAARPNEFQPRQYHGHAHDVDGIWDRDNGALAGCQCVACMVHRAAIANAEKRP